MSVVGYPVRTALPFSSYDLRTGPPWLSEVPTAFTQWYSQVDAGLIASHVWRLEFLHKDDNDTDEEHKVNLRSRDKAGGNDHSGKRPPIPLPLHRLLVPQQGPPPPSQDPI